MFGFLIVCMLLFSYLVNKKYDLSFRLMGHCLSVVVLNFTQANVNLKKTVNKNIGHTEGRERETEKRM